MDYTVVYAMCDRSKSGSVVVSFSQAEYHLNIYWMYLMKIQI